FERLVTELELERDLSYHPLVQVLFTLQNMPFALPDLPGLTVEALDPDIATAKVDIHLSLQEIEDELQGRIEYDSVLFDRDRVERMVGHLTVLLEGIAANPERRLSELPLLTTAERQQVLVEWNRTERSYPSDRTIPLLFEQQAARTPEAIAVVSEDRHLTYRELDERANQLAHHLHGLGVGPETLVGICCERSLELIVGLLGILKAGGAYVPMDPMHPLDRLAFMLDDSGVRVLLTQEALTPRLPATGAQVVRLDGDWPRIAGGSNGPVPSGLEPDHLAYMIYTSGSTGQPKGALNAHRAILNRLLWMHETFGLGPHDRMLQKTPVTFDVSVWELFCPLTAGARLVMARPEGHKDPTYLRTVIREQEITLVHFVPSMLQAFLHEPGLEDCTSLRRVVCSGEALTADLRDLCFERLPWVELHNLYGPTEAAVEVTAWVCQPDDHDPAVPIGRPIANTQAYILDSHRQPVPIGVPGELCIGGVQVGRGYLDRPELTAERFVPDPFSPEAEARLYRTGDLVRYRADGNIEYLGRLDQQVKIRGFRIEPGEIEAALTRHPAVREAAVVARDDQPSGKRLVAYVVSEGSGASAAELRGYVGLRLPDYMIPAAFVYLDALPLLSNGKLDRRALPTPEVPRPDLGDDYVAPRTPTEEKLAEIWTRVLGIEGVGIHDSFFDLGGDSILSMQVVARARQAGLEIHPTHLFRHDTIAELAPVVKIARSSERASSPVDAPLVALDQRQLDRILARVSDEKEPRS
ncbi:MAG: amino acid adenylation domain-containing protein, partial [Chloroflexi bacterium]|nr:amino acid adenylation domain-containing protein [Chloroflexota bacterium]